MDHCARIDRDQKKRRARATAGVESPVEQEKEDRPEALTILRRVAPIAAEVGKPKQRGPSLSVLFCSANGSSGPA
jgi:hypothetical protein